MIKLKKKSIKSLSLDKAKLPVEYTAEVAGAADKPYSYYDNCTTQPMTNLCTDLCTPSVGAGCATSNMC
ncbi:hypothetical protein [Pseudoalteromonas phenolica]|jgi:hypothetical protein|uniref:hypothetical protein n=1 Tax=Pseudoalteromonas phenolica TaxID=161398 RepID=UPI00384D62A3|tara:strand:- start:818 stop:1024 length:207 start_codon:yes stop_codon:yes gene_type:complete